MVGMMKYPNFVTEEVRSEGNEHSEASERSELHNIYIFYERNHLLVTSLLI